MKIDELKVEQLKKELGKLDLPTAGSKGELQKRLIDEFKRRNIDIAAYKFEEIEVAIPALTSNIDLSTMFAAMMEQTSRNPKKMVKEKNGRKFKKNRIKFKKSRKK